MSTQDAPAATDRLAADAAARPAGAQHPERAESTCCRPEEEAACCEPSEKAGCCDTAARGGCGCR